MAQGFEIEGNVKVINDVQTFASGFTKREFVVEVQDGNYPQMIKFETVKDKTSLVDGLNIGEPVKVFFDIRGNEYNGKYYVNLNAWKLERTGGGAAAGGGRSNQGYQGGEPSPEELRGSGGGGGGGFYAGNPADMSDSGDDIPF